MQRIHSLEQGSLINTQLFVRLPNCRILKVKIILQYDNKMKNNLLFGYGHNSRGHQKGNPSIPVDHDGVQRGHNFVRQALSLQRLLTLLTPMQKLVKFSFSIFLNNSLNHRLYTVIICKQISNSLKGLGKNYC